MSNAGLELQILRGMPFKTTAQEHLRPPHATECLEI